MLWMVSIFFFFLCVVFYDLRYVTCITVADLYIVSLENFTRRLGLRKSLFIRFMKSLPMFDVTHLL